MYLVFRPEKRMKRILLSFGLMLQACGSQAASMQWYIMLGAFKQENHGEIAASNLRNTAFKCGFDAKFDYSVTLRGTTLGLRSLVRLENGRSLKTCFPASRHASRKPTSSK
jgi:hypothetical protein